MDIGSINAYLTNLSQMDFPFFINWTIPFPILGFWGIFKRNFCKQTAENLIRQRILLGGYGFKSYYNFALTLFILDKCKQILLQKVKTLLKCHIMQYFIRVCIVWKIKTNIHHRNASEFRNFHM